MQVWNVLHMARWKYRTQSAAKKWPSAHDRTTLSSWIFATKACIDNRKKNLLTSNISSTRPHNMANFCSLAAEISSEFGHHSKFNGFCVGFAFGFVSGATSFTRGQPNFARYLTVSWAATLYIYTFGGSCPLKEFCHMRNSLCVQDFLCPTLAAFLHGTPAAGSAKLYGVVQGMELWNFCRGRHLYSAGRPSRLALAHILVYAESI